MTKQEIIEMIERVGFEQVWKAALDSAEQFSIDNADKEILIINFHETSKKWGQVNEANVLIKALSDGTIRVTIKPNANVDARPPLFLNYSTFSENK